MRITSILLPSGAALDGSVQPYGTNDGVFSAEAIVFKLESTPTRRLILVNKAAVSTILKFPIRSTIQSSSLNFKLIFSDIRSPLDPKSINFASGSSNLIPSIIWVHFSYPICL